MTITRRRIGTGGGTSGQDGITPHVGGNGNWFIGATDTGIHAQGPQGVPGTPGADGSGAAIDTMPFTTVEEVPRTAAGGTVSADDTYMLLGVAMIPCVITACAVVMGSIASQSATSYWTVELGKIEWAQADGGVSAPPLQPFVSKPTFGQSINNALGENVVSRRAWTFDAVPWDYDLATLAPRDSLFARWRKTGTPGNVSVSGYSFLTPPLRTVLDHA